MTYFFFAGTTVTKSENTAAIANPKITPPATSVSQCSPESTRKIGIAIIKRMKNASINFSSTRTFFRVEFPTIFRIKTSDVAAIPTTSIVCVEGKDGLSGDANIG